MKIAPTFGAFNLPMPAFPEAASQRVHPACLHQKHKLNKPNVYSARKSDNLRAE
jgi:hypothetical protein